MKRRDFIKNAALGVLAMNFFPEKIFAANETADLVIYGNFYTVDEKILVQRQLQLRTVNLFMSARLTALKIISAKIPSNKNIIAE